MKDLDYVFDGSWIYKLVVEEINNNLIVIIGGQKYVKLYKIIGLDANIDKLQLLFISKQHSNDWIFDIILVPIDVWKLIEKHSIQAQTSVETRDIIALGSAHSLISFFDVDKNEKIHATQCEEKSIMYPV